MKNFTPRHMRKKYNNKSGGGQEEKKKAFRRAALWSKRFINQPASYLEKPSVAPHYAVWCDRSRPGKGIR